jgi:hypothetical protein
MSTTDPTQQPIAQPQPTAQPSPSAPPVSEPDTITVSRADYDAMQDQLHQARSTYDVLNPHSSRIERLIKDPHAAELFDRAVRAYEDMGRREPEIDPSIKPVWDKVSRVEKFVDEFEARQKDEAERPQREFTARFNDWQNSPANNRFFTRLMTDHPDLRPRDLQYLAQVAAENQFEPLEAVWKKESWRFERPGSSAPPTSLRADAGEVGSAPQPGQPPQGKTMRERIIELERARRGA